MQSIQKNYIEAAPRFHQPMKEKPAFEQGNRPDLIHPLSLSQNLLYQDKVRARRRKGAKHPLRDYRIRAGYTLKELADVIQMSPSYLSRIEGGSRRLNSDILETLSQALSCRPADLLPQKRRHTGGKEMETATPSVEKDLPVYRLAGTMETHGHIYTDVVEQWILRPVELSGIKGAFACVIQDSSFGPRYSDGDRILIHPTAPFSNQCSVLAITNDNEAYIGRFMSWDGREAMAANPLLTLEISSSKRDELPKIQKVTFERSQLKGIYRIIGTLEAA
jgi:transcriptional regulator with XRE-family HTH domain